MPTGQEQQEQTAGVLHFYQDIQRDDRNNYLAGNSGIVNHHFGIGQIDWTRYPPIENLTQEQIKTIINELELHQIDVLMETMGTVQPHHRVLDAGSGRGGTSFSIAKATGARVDGITIAPYQARFAQDLEESHWNSRLVNFTVMNMLQLGFHPDTYDHVITNETTMYITNLPQLFEGFRRVLKLGGTYTLATWCINEKYLGRDDITERINSHYPGTRMHTQAEYVKALESTGFQINNNRDLTEDVIPHWVIRSRWEKASGIEPTYLEGHRERKLLYKMISATKND